MATHFWDVQGIITVDFAPRGATVNAVVCQATLQSLKEADSRGLITRGFLLLIIMPHSTLLTPALSCCGLAAGTFSPRTVQSRIGPIGHSSVCKLKNNLRYLRLPFDGTVKAEAYKFLREQDVSLYHQGLRSLAVRYYKCLIKFGKYVVKYRANVD
jgi:hypothetical protein